MIHVSVDSNSFLCYCLAKKVFFISGRPSLRMFKLAQEFCLSGLCQGKAYTYLLIYRDQQDA